MGGTKLLFLLQMLGDHGREMSLYYIYIYSYMAKNLHISHEERREEGGKMVKHEEKSQNCSYIKK